MLRYVDLDGTLAEYHGWKGYDHIGAPIPAMVDKVWAWLRAGDEVVIFTARAVDWDGAHPEAKHMPTIIATIQDWTEKYFGVRMKVTGTKGPWDHAYDDGINQVVRNTGKTLQEHVLEQIDELTDIHGLLAKALVSWNRSMSCDAATAMMRPGRS